METINDCSHLIFPKPKKRPKNRAAKKKRDGRYCPERLAVLRTMPCAVCGGRAEPHHVRTKARRSRDDYRTIPLCRVHHSAQAPGLSVHGTPAEFAEFYGESGEDVLSLYDAKFVKDGLGRLVKG